MEIDMTGIDKAAALAALYNASRPQGMGWLVAKAADMSHTEAAAILSEREDAYFDYLQGRVLKIDLNENPMGTRLYDRDNGEGAAARAIEPLRSKAAA